MITTIYIYIDKLRIYNIFENMECLFVQTTVDSISVCHCEAAKSLINVNYKKSSPT